MAAIDPVSRIRPEERVEGGGMPGMVREEAIAIEGLWSGLVRTDAHKASAWHHHGDYETSIFVVTGAVRLECGPEGSVVVEAEAGDFLHVPKGAIHRESNPGDTESQLVVVRAGHGPPVIDVDGPAPRQP